MGELAVPYLRVLLPGAVAMAGFVLFVELTTHRTIGAAQGKKLAFFGLPVDSTAVLPWVLGVAAMLVGALWLRAESRGFMVKWNALMEDAKARGIAV